MDFNRQRSLVAEHGTPEASSAQPPPPPPPQKPADVPFRPSIAVIVVVLTTMFSLTFLLLLYAKHCRRQAAATAPPPPPAATGGGGVAALGRTAEDRTSGVERAVVESLPLFRFASLMGEKDGIECAVCLSRFEAEALLRLLPKCRHAFHIDCVDAWLDSHSTCPLCRSRVHPEDVLLLLRPDPPLPPLVTAAPPSRRISGRHSSAGEKASGCAIAVLVDRQRKDGLLLPEVEGVGGQYSHRVVFSGGGSRERWSDLRPSDLMFLRSETTITASGTTAELGGGVFRIGLRNEPDLTSVNRVSRTGGAEERTMRRWVRIAGKRTAGWLGGDENG
ncbi:RING-H2 finger protein ATL43 [Phalaenopsis equestris]|uniref:RING-H2 finger protein ATL43 n=1 Tax=Phalaenopsis equestris TaxID=78828 RepID=UPI0009E359C9|nr:RING-H2 finger protein ATL43 [Phalaenopsis equestris]